MCGNIKMVFFLKLSYSGTYVFTATRKTLYIAIIIFDAFACLEIPLTAPELQNRIPTESTQRGHEITIRDFN